MPFISFPCFTVLSRTSSSMLNKSMGVFALFLILGKNILSFIINYNISLIKLRNFPSISSFLRVFIMNGYGILSNVFFVSSDIIMIFLLACRKSVLNIHWRTDAESPILWPPDVKNWLFRKDPDAGKDWRQEEKGMTEDEMIGWHPWLDGPKFEQAPGVADRQGGLVCWSPWGCKESDTTEQLNWTELLVYHVVVFQSLSHVHCFVTPWTAACQASLSFAIS